MRICRNLAVWSRAPEVDRCVCEIYVLYTCIYIYIHTHTYMHTCIRTYIHTYTHTYVLHTSINSLSSVPYLSSYCSISMCVCVLCVCVFVYIYIYMYTHVLLALNLASLLQLLPLGGHRGGEEGPVLCFQDEDVEGN